MTKVDRFSAGPISNRDIYIPCFLRSKCCISDLHFASTGMVLQFEQPGAFTIRCQFVFPGLQFGLNEAVIILNFTVPVTDFSVSPGYHKTQFQHNACMSGHSISGYETTSGHSKLQRNITNNLVINKRSSERANERKSARTNPSTHANTNTSSKGTIERINGRRSIIV